MKIINLTPTRKRCWNKVDGRTVRTGGAVLGGREKLGEINGIPVNRSRFGKVENLPEPQSTIFIVSP